MSPSPENPFRQKPLVLVPTEPERDRLQRAGLACELVGFGPVAAAARTASYLARWQPQEVILVGIAGTYDAARLAPGEAAAFGHIALWGVGVGQGSEHQSAGAMGWPLWPAENGRAAAGDRLQAASGEHGLITVCAASAHAQDTRAILAQHPSALAEDMEAFGVALACYDAGVPFHCLRGISNLAGERDPSKWRMRAALDAVAELALAEFPGLRQTSA